VDTHTDEITDAIDHPTHASATACVGNNTERSVIGSLPLAAGRDGRCATAVCIQFPVSVVNYSSKCHRTETMPMTDGQTDRPTDRLR